MISRSTGIFQPIKSKISLTGIVQARFITSSPDFTVCPKPVMPEYAFIGRSNVGKSSLINMVTGQKMLAKTSSTPGKTQLINHFLINDSWYLVDLPGYGYARTAKTNRQKWEKVIEQYLLKRENLMSTFILIDSRLPLQANDRNVINWFGDKGLHFILIFTKTDKLTPNQLASGIETVKKELLTEWEEIPPYIITSSHYGKGRDEILKFIEETNLLFKA
jgi:GTP-binding protein